jgi:hypothetical protein
MHRSIRNHNNSNGHSHSYHGSGVDTKEDWQNPKHLPDVKEMVERVESQGLQEFQGVVESIELEEGLNDNKQYHMIIEPTDIKVGGKTGKIHDWIPLSAKSTDDRIAKGSVMDGFLRQVEICVSGAKSAKTVSEALGMLVGNKFQFNRIELGRAYEGNAARQYSVPVKAL